MIASWCRFLLARAARRWPADLRAEMIAEWQAELHAMPGAWRRLRYAASLAAAEPHRRAGTVLSPGRRVASALLSFLLVAALPAGYLPLTINWTWYMTVDSVRWQTWVAGASVAGAVVLGIICARVTTGVTQLINPLLVPLWAVAPAYLALLALPLWEGRLPDRSTVIDVSCWALSAVVLGTAAAWVALAGRPLLSWGAVALAVTVSFWFSHMHSSLSHFETHSTYFFGGRFLPAYLFDVAATGYLHATIFLLVYAHHLVRRHRPGEQALVERSAAA
ncbi:hypothetical protein CS0771_55910 [Catellatospora sp. IY07-71]|uniref:hypothetical protein n=1 Tax=Catellatospora sp. IY07-71 TaxID=2728827 RepID=UPI001BB43002|nr:hypothetical protein [Catellatospora sp. IY07-71]BCJ76047.1 hypothetical protein CS0771_55910 [Catellatospora sp. IY07-71]